MSPPSAPVDESTSMPWPSSLPRMMISPPWDCSTIGPPIEIMEPPVCKVSVSLPVAVTAPVGWTLPWSHRSPVGVDRITPPLVAVTLASTVSEASAPGASTSTAPANTACPAPAWTVRLRVFARSPSRVPSVMLPPAAEVSMVTSLVSRMPVAPVAVRLRSKFVAIKRRG
jgi:hypothetical protein